MRATWFGARSGRNAIVTAPLVVAIRRVSSGSAILLGSFHCKTLRDEVGGNAHRDDAVGVRHRAVVLLGAGAQAVDKLHAFKHAADDRVLAIEPGGGSEHDEELRIGAVGALRAGHA